MAASFFGPVRLVGVVGDDFPKKYLSSTSATASAWEGLQHATGKTFHWAGEYEVNMNNRRTLNTELGVIEHYSPNLPDAYRDTPYVLLANISPSLQHQVLDQMKRANSSSRTPWTSGSTLALPDLLRLLKRVGLPGAQRQRGAPLVKEDTCRRRQKNPPARAQIRDREKGRARIHFVIAQGHVRRPRLPVAQVVDPTARAIPSSAA